MQPSKPPAKTHPYWDRPPQSERGDPTVEPIYQQVGYALSRWAVVESWFSGMFNVFLSARDIGAAERVFGLFYGTPGRIDALEQVSDEAFFRREVPSDTRTAWKLLTDHYRAAGGLRNDIAHGAVVRDEVNGEDCFFLTPHYHNPKRTDPFWKAPHSSRNKYKYTSGDIQAIGLKFQHLARWVSEFLVEYAGKYPQEE